MNAETPRFLLACAGQATDTTPIWLMRQAGRYMPEYRNLRKRHTMLEIIKDPALSCEATLQPMEAFELDAAIIFSDILPPLEAMGLTLEFLAGDGPRVTPPVRSARDVGSLRVPHPEEELSFVLEAIRLARRALNGTPLIGFAGGPFTLACYAIEGGTSRDQRRAKDMMLRDRAAWHCLMSKLADVVGRYLVAQARAGAQALQIFDSWAGALSPSDYRSHVLPYTRRAIELARSSGVPIIHFGTGTAGMLEDMHEAGADVLGIDWRVDLGTARRRLKPATAIQGNLDPIALMAPWPEVRARADDVLSQAANAPGHIFNLGHGILPETPVDNVRRLVDHVHNAGAGA